MHVYMYFSVCLHVFACVFACVCVSVCVIVGGVCVFVTVCMRMYLCVSACVPRTVAGASLGLTLRGRGLPVHVYTPVARLNQWYPVGHSLVVGFIHLSKHHHTAFCPEYVERREGVPLEESNISTV